MRFLLTLIIIMFSFSATAAIYKTIDKNGNVTFSDQPSRKSEEVKLKPTSTFSDPQQQAPVENTKSQQRPDISGVPDQLEANNQEKVAKPEITFSNIKNKQTFQNQNRIPIAFNLSEKLPEGHKIQLYFNGKPYGAAKAGPFFVLERGQGGVDRGTHTVSGAIVNDKGKEISKTDTRTIYIHYPNINTRAAEFKPLKKPEHEIIIEKAILIAADIMGLKQPAQKIVEASNEHKYGHK